jgi:4-aminobutyrate aminotransferase-like enzyme
LRYRCFGSINLHFRRRQACFNRFGKQGRALRIAHGRNVLLGIGYSGDFTVGHCHPGIVAEIQETLTALTFTKINYLHGDEIS